MLVVAATLAACDGAPSHALDIDAPRSAAQAAPGAGARLPTRPSFCARPGDDRIRDAFCGPTQPVVDGMRALQDLIGVNPRPRPDGAPLTGDEDVFDLTPAAVLLGHSTALGGRLVSPLNPRAIVVGREVMLAFQRGVQQVELAARSRTRGTFNFYLLSFEQACNGRTDGCVPGDLYTPRVERDWQPVALEDDEELKNTPSDCRQCHQRGRRDAVLLMRELQSPWTHFFEKDTVVEGDGALPGVRGFHLLRDYLDAKGDEPYAALSTQTISDTIGLLLQNAVAPEQPLLFDAPRIDDERYPLGPNGFAPEPLESATWERGYAAFKRGEQLALPYFDARPTDPTKQAALARAYRRMRAGELPPEALPDLADVFPDDPRVRARIGLQNEPGAGPVDALIQACASCHNDVLDQTISRARFNVGLARMSRAEREVAIARLTLPPGAFGAMPPPEARALDADARARLIAYLRHDVRPQADDARLEHAAARGMAGGAGH